MHRAGFKSLEPIAPEKTPRYRTRQAYDQYAAYAAPLLLESARKKYEVALADGVPPYASTGQEIQECTFDELFNSSDTKLGGKSFVRIVNVDTRFGKSSYVAKRYRTWFKRYEGDLTRAKFVKSFPVELRDLINKAIDISGFVGIPGVLDPCFQMFIPPTDIPGFDKRYAADGDLMCDDQYHEFLIGMCINSLMTEQYTIHFPLTYDILACNPPKEEEMTEEEKKAIDDEAKEKRALDPSVFNYYILVELLNGARPVDAVFDDIGDDVMLQALHTIHLLHYVYQISHNDLHGQNIMVQLVENTPMALSGDNRDYAFWEYHVMGYRLYIPRPRYLVRIIDFGLSCKFSTPKICSKPVATGEFANIYPPRFSPAGDLLCAIKTLTRPQVGDVLAQTPKKQASVWSHIYSYLHQTAMAAGVAKPPPEQQRPSRDALLQRSMTRKQKQHVAVELYSYIYGRAMTLDEIRLLFRAPELDETTPSGEFRYTEEEADAFQDLLYGRVPVAKYPTDCPSVADVILKSGVFDRFRERPDPSEGAILLVATDKVPLVE